MDLRLRTRASRFALLSALASLLALPAAPAGADQIEKFQHGGRATAQAGAFTARADEPSALTYNPAAIVRLNGLQVQGGLDFSNSTDDYASPSGAHRANHSIQFPPAVYATWRPGGHGALAYGLGIDTPIWYRLDWNTALFPGRFRTRTQELRLFQVHPVVAWELNDQWSVGGGLRYLFGTLEHGFNTPGEVGGGDSPISRFELESLAEADVDALSFDLGVHYKEVAWGFGLVYENGADLKETGSLSIRVRDLGDPALADLVLLAFPYDRARQQFELPRRIRGGVWIAPYPELRIELDAAFSNWSGLDNTNLTLRSSTVDPLVIPQDRGWDDTVSLRLGAEGDLSDTWSLGGGIAWEPSPVPDKTAEPGFPRGDTLVYALGGSYNLPDLSIDVGYAFHDFADREVSGQEPLAPEVRARYSGHDQVWSVSARWRF